MPSVVCGPPMMDPLACVEQAPIDVVTVADRTQITHASLPNLPLDGIKTARCARRAGACPRFAAGRAGVAGLTRHVKSNFSSSERASICRGPVARRRRASIPVRSLLVVCRRYVLGYMR